MKTIIAWAAVALGFGTMAPAAPPQTQTQTQPQSPAQAQAQAENAAPRQLAIVPTIAATPASKAGKAEARSAYLLAYFKDETHSLHFATSPDGYVFTDVNGGEPVLRGRAVADQQGIRDPHIMRGPDGAFYMSMTDLHIFAEREGLRTTRWERPEKDYGWGNNRNMLFMKSHDMLHWTLAKVDIAALFPAYRNAGNAWAPETIYDPAKKRMMVYFTTRMGNGPNYMVYAYADPAFTTLTTVPKQILYYPRPAVNTIDADITKIGGKYRMFYVVHEQPGSIRQAVSSRIDGGYVHDPRKVDPENVAAEAPNLWRRHGTDTYVLMYDVFGVKPNNMGFAETTDFQTFRDIGRFNDPGSRMKATNFSQPKHGTVMAITPAEADRLRGWFAR